MAPSVIFKYQSPDSTAYLNQRLASLITKGVYDGGTLAPLGGGSLSATRLPFLAIGKDGVTIADSESTTITYTASIANYHCILAKYNPYGVPSTPTVSELILTSGEYIAHRDKAYLILLAIVTPTTELLLTHINYNTRESVGPFGHVWMKGTVATASLLPVDTGTVLAGNRIGDLYLVLADWGVYVWTGVTPPGWRLIAAMGAATLDGAYDDNNGTAIPGAGRKIWADAGAVEIIQSTASQRQNDLANAALRIDKTGSTTYGDVGLDIKVREDYDFGSILIRQSYQDGGMTLAEPIDIMGPNTIQGIRSGVDWTSVQRPSALLVEISGSALGNDGLYLVDIIASDQVNTRFLNANPTAFVVEPGLTATFYTIRSSIGSSNSFPAMGDAIGLSVGSVEHWGTNGDESSIGKIWYVEADKLGYVWQVRRSDPAEGVFSSFVAGVDQYGAGFFSSSVSYGLIGNTTASGVSGVFGTCTEYDSVGVYGLNDNGIGIRGSGGEGVEGVAYDTSGTGVRGIQASDDPDGYGVYGIGLNGSIGVFGECVGDNAGVEGTSSNGNGVEGIADYGSGVKGQSTYAPGVYGYSYDYAGVFGYSVNVCGVWGANYWNATQGVLGTSEWTGSPSSLEEGAGVWGSSTKGVGVYGSSAARSGVVGVATSRVEPGVVGYNTEWPPCIGSEGDDIFFYGSGGVTFADYDTDFEAAGVNAGDYISVGVGASANNKGTFVITSVDDANHLSYTNSKGSSESGSFSYAIGLASRGIGVAGYGSSGVGVLGLADEDLSNPSPGVSGSSFAHYTAITQDIYVPLTCGQPQGLDFSGYENTWQFKQYISTNEPHWLYDTNINPGYSYSLYFHAHDWPDQMKLNSVTAVVQGGGSPTLACYVTRYSLNKTTGVRNYHRTDSVSAAVGTRTIMTVNCANANDYWNNLRRTNDYIEIEFYPSTNSSGKFYYIFGLWLNVTYQAVCPYYTTIGPS